MLIPVPFQATSLSKLRHPDLLHMIEPLEETRTELTFVTEPVVDSLGGVVGRMKGDSRRKGEEELDEVEVGSADNRIMGRLTKRRFKKGYYNLQGRWGSCIHRRNSYI
jgi:hypothetical protein